MVFALKRIVCCYGYLLSRHLCRFLWWPDDNVRSSLLNNAFVILGKVLGDKRCKWCRKQIVWDSTFERLERVSIKFIEALITFWGNYRSDLVWSKRFWWEVSTSDGLSYMHGIFCRGWWLCSGKQSWRVTDSTTGRVPTNFQAISEYFNQISVFLSNKLEQEECKPDLSFCPFYGWWMVIQFSPDASNSWGRSVGMASDTLLAACIRRGVPYYRYWVAKSCYYEVMPRMLYTVPELAQTQDRLKDL